MEDLYQKHLNITNEIIKSNGNWVSYEEPKLDLDEIAKTLKTVNTPDENGNLLTVTLPEFINYPEN
jgi:hypothetical protein